MSASESLYALIQQLGMTAIEMTAATQAIRTARLVDQREQSDELENEARGHMDRLVRLSITFTARLMAESSPDPSSTIATTTARDLEAWLTICLNRESAPALQTSLHKAVQKLATAGATFGLIMTAVVKSCATTGEDPFKAGAGTPAREQTYALARAAVVFTTQLLGIFNQDLDPDAAREQAAVMEDELVAFLDASPWYEENL